MPGPKMGERPIDFDEMTVRRAPTFQKWLTLRDGEKIRYACRDFIKGNGNDEERLMRRIMIARRNNIRDHEMLKRARQNSRCTTPTTTTAAVVGNTVVPTAASVIGGGGSQVDMLPPPLALPKIVDHERLDGGLMSMNVGMTNSVAMDMYQHQQVVPQMMIQNNKKRKEMTNHNDHSCNTNDIDLPAVEATRSYKAWLTLPDGAEFTYNQRYVKGKEGHEWLLKKNIWRRMRYRRENKKMIDRMKQTAVIQQPVLHPNNTNMSLTGAPNNVPLNTPSSAPTSLEQQLAHVALASAQAALNGGDGRDMSLPTVKLENGVASVSNTNPQQLSAPLIKLETLEHHPANNAAVALQPQHLTASPNHNPHHHSTNNNPPMTADDVAASIEAAAAQASVNIDMNEYASALDAAAKLAAASVTMDDATAAAVAGIQVSGVNHHDVTSVVHNNNGIHNEDVKPVVVIQPNASQQQNRVAMV